MVGGYRLPALGSTQQSRCDENDEQRGCMCTTTCKTGSWCQPMTLPLAGPRTRRGRVGWELMAKRRGWCEEEEEIGTDTVGTGGEELKVVFGECLPLGRQPYPTRGDPVQSANRCRLSFHPFLPPVAERHQATPACYQFRKSKSHSFIHSSNSPNSSP